MEEIFKDVFFKMVDYYDAYCAWYEDKGNKELELEMNYREALSKKSVDFLKENDLDKEHSKWLDTNKDNLTNLMKERRAQKESKHV